MATFPIDHVVPKAAGGSNEMGNLALTCPHGNSHKWAAATGPDPAGGEPVRLFHPRSDVWAERFAWSAAAPGERVGRPPTGRATIAELGINNPDMLELRSLLGELGLFPETTG